jgi:hypothetical protein
MQGIRRLEVAEAVTGGRVPLSQRLVRDRFYIGTALEHGEEDHRCEHAEEPCRRRRKFAVNAPCILLGFFRLIVFGDGHLDDLPSLELVPHRKIIHDRNLFLLPG